MDIQQDNEKQNIRNRHIDIRLTEEEYKMVVEKAAECGLTLSNYGRKLLQNHHPSKRLSDEEVQGLNSLSDARADLIRIQNVLKGKPDEIKKRYFRDKNDKIAISEVKKHKEYEELKLNKAITDNLFSYDPQIRN